MEWQPIETAPKDGQVILVVSNFGGNFHPYVGIAHWEGDCKDNDLWRAGMPDEWRDAEGRGDEILGFHKPTHWMPLPKPPTD